METEQKEERVLLIKISKELSEILQKICGVEGKSEEETAAKALDRCFGGRLPKKERFYNGRHFAMPRSCFILFALPIHEWQKLREWIDQKQRPDIIIGSNGEVVLINETKLAKHITGKAAKIEREAP